MRFPRSSLAIAAAVALGASTLAGCSDGGDGTGGRGGTGASASARASSPPADAWIPGHVAKMSLQDKVGQLFVPTFYSRADALRTIRRYKVGGLIYFPENFGSPEETAAQSNALQKASKIPLVLGVDEEQGIVTRTPFITRFPGNMALGATADPAQARAAARVTGAELRAVGINLDYAPVADVNVNPNNPVIGVRSFGSDPARVSRMVTGAVKGYQDAGVAAVAKHFPGHGDTATDSHTGLPVIEHSPDEWRKIDAPPFEAAIGAGVDAIMTAHIVVPNLDRSGDPATLSKSVLTGLLREKLGYDGVITTDSLRMEGVRTKYGDGAVAVRAVQAGADQLLMPPDLPEAYEAVLKAVESGKITRQRLDASVTRILRLKQRRGLFDQASVDPAKAGSVIGSAQHEATARQVAEKAVTLVADKGGVLPLKGKTVAVTGPKAEALADALRAQGVRTASPGSADVTVLTTDDAGAATAARVRALGGAPVVVAALGSPYDLDSARGAAATLAAYSSGTASLQGLARVLAGTVKPTGKLPVPAGGQQVGHGLTYP
ncbi:glycoside hydrolase family 3 protein [Actinomadura algeriensis]|uniref:beta-N-acetylhexosaminidase n=1 Tax=Actinomadura algeriensis TaxID=1679523 RepID=A0ABR9JLE8_9ACTN|nr:glycoside hydrolase family 3 N-terminal domain-containing protein [Actinomadura algeriensis]MBE1531381.1 beta-N-acetylhexosaminidase [Actinomadura algeriensis]